MKDFAVIGGVIGVLVDIPLIIGIIRGNIKQNFLTYFLWGLLDAIACITIILQNGNFWLPMGYSVGAMLVAILLLIKWQFSWTRVETLVIILIVLCLLIWWQVGNNAGTIATVFALSIASIPQIIETYKDPKNTPTWLYVVFLLAGILSFIGGESYSIEDRLYPFGVIMISGTIMIISLRKK